MGLKFARHLDLYKLDWQAGLICTLVGSNQIDANVSKAKEAVANLFARSFAAPVAA